VTDTPLEPTTAGELAQLLKDARSDTRLVPRGSGTKLSWGAPFAPSDRFVSTRGLSSPLEHYAGDLIATIPAGVTLIDANDVLAQARQCLPLDPPFADRATIGGIVATNDSGPRRHRYGAPRDLIVGIEVALTDGRVVKAGGRVVKNVAGYDLSRLLCGSHGRLGVITSATFKLSPIPPVSRTVIASLPDLDRLLGLAQALIREPVTPAAVELQAPAGRLLVRFETTERAADHMAAVTCALLDAAGATTRVAEGEDEAREWHTHEHTVWNAPQCVVKISVLPTGLAAVCRTLDEHREVRWAAIGRASLGILLVRLDGHEDEIVRIVLKLRTLMDRSGHATVLVAPEGIKMRLRPVPVASDLAAVMHAVKSNFDPRGVLRAEP
jgi:glycolate oxidase FAD binding subunit